MMIDYLYIKETFHRLIQRFLDIISLLTTPEQAGVLFWCISCDSLTFSKHFL
jgi:hypothetical protein